MDPDHLAVFRQGVAEWNRWRAEYFQRPDLREVDLRAARLRGIDLHETQLDKADLSSALLTGAKLHKANLSGANLSGANLMRANLRAAHLSRANFSGAHLREANLSKAFLLAADLSNANFSSANLSEAKFFDADLSNANLSGANLTGANLTGVNLTSAKFHGANLSGAEIGKTIIGDVDLSVAKGLDTIRHAGPSTIGIDTINRSGGEIPEIFLRGAGVPDNFIAYIGSLVGKPREFYSCFISYSTTDQKFADRLYADLQGKGVRCWFAPHDIAGGKKIHEQIDEAIQLHDRLLLILSPASMASKWVKTEISKARKREEKEERRVLFPVRLVTFELMRGWQCFDADIGIDSAAEIREFFIPDFSNWQNHDSYQRAFEQLLRDLKAEAQKA